MLAQFAFNKISFNFLIQKCVDAEWVFINLLNVFEIA